MILCCIFCCFWNNSNNNNSNSNSNSDNDRTAAAGTKKSQRNEWKKEIKGALLAPLCWQMMETEPRPNGVFLIGSTAAVVFGRIITTVLFLVSATTGNSAGGQLFYQQIATLMWIEGRSSSWNRKKVGRGGGGGTNRLKKSIGEMTLVPTFWFPLTDFARFAAHGPARMFNV